MPQGKNVVRSFLPVSVSGNSGVEIANEIFVDVKRHIIGEYFKPEGKPILRALPPNGFSLNDPTFKEFIRIDRRDHKELLCDYTTKKAQNDMKKYQERGEVVSVVVFQYGPTCTSADAQYLAKSTMQVDRAGAASIQEREKIVGQLKQPTYC